MNLEDEAIAGLDLDSVILEMVKHNQKASAIALCRKRLSFNRNDHNAQYYLGILLVIGEEYAIGLDFLLNLPAIYDNNIKRLEAIIISALQLKRHELILTYGESFIKNQKRIQAEIAFSCGEIFMNDKQNYLAYQCFKIASLDPKTVEASYLKIMEICRNDQPEIGLEHALLYLTLKPEELYARLRVAYYHFDLNKFEEAEALLNPLYELVIRNEEMLGMDLVGLAYLYLKLFNYEKAKLICQYALDKTTDSNQLQLQYFLYFIEGYFGNYLLSWQKSEYRLKSNNPFHLQQSLYKLVQNLKLIKDFEFSKGFRLILIAEQGLGDNIMMLRYLPLLQAKLKQCYGKLDILITPELRGLIPLFAEFTDGNIITQENVDQINSNVPNYDGMVGIISLPFLFSKDYPSPIPSIPFNVPSEKIVMWQKKIKHKTRKIRIGLSLNTAHKNLSRRIPLEFIQPWFELELEFMVIQDIISAELKESIKDKENVIFFENEIKDFGDSAAILQHCDLFIGLDSAMAHLAATIGLRTITLHPTPAMGLFPNRKLKDPNALDSLWYPNMEIIRQPSRGDWENVSLIVLDKLQKLLNHES